MCANHRLLWIVAAAGLVLIVPACRSALASDNDVRRRNCCRRGEVRIVISPETLREIDSGATTPRVAGKTPFVLHANHPNPFNPSTRIRFTLESESRVSLVIYDVSGRPVRALVSGTRPSGNHVAEWDGRDNAGRNVASGVYLYRIIAGNAAITRKAVLLR